MGVNTWLLTFDLVNTRIKTIFWPRQLRQGQLSKTNVITVQVTENGYETYGHNGLFFLL